MKRRPVVVVGGGWSGERAISLMSLEGVARSLKEGGWEASAVDLLPDRGSPRPATPAFAEAVRLGSLVARLRRRPGTLAFLALHGTGGEDGRIQGLLDLAQIPYTGSGVLASALAMDKALAKRVLASSGVPTPRGVVLARGEAAPEGIPLPAVVKPVSQGSALGLGLVRRRRDLAPALRAAWRWDRAALVEEYLPGRECTVAVLGDEALPVVEILPSHETYDFHSKYAPGGSRHLCPAPLPARVASAARDLGLRAHRALGCRAFSRTDMILGRGAGWRVLEVNTLPGLTPVSLLPDAARAAGMSYTRLLEAMMDASLKDR